MLVIETEKGKVLVNNSTVDLQEYTSNMAKVFGFNQLYLKTVEGNLQTLWFNEKSYAIKELIPTDILMSVKKEYGIA